MATGGLSLSEVEENWLSCIVAKATQAKDKGRLYAGLIAGRQLGDRRSLGEFLFRRSADLAGSSIG